MLAVAGPDYAIVAGDTRMSTGFNIKCRNVSKIYEINSKTVLGSGGFRGDITTLQKLLRAKVTQYEFQHGETVLPHSLAQSLANTLYGRRFFPYYTWNVVAGLDQQGARATPARGTAWRHGAGAAGAGGGGGGEVAAAGARHPTPLRPRRGPT